MIVSIRRPSILSFCFFFHCFSVGWRDQDTHNNKTVISLKREGGFWRIKGGEVVATSLVALSHHHLTTLYPLVLPRPPRRRPPPLGVILGSVSVRREAGRPGGRGGEGGFWGCKTHRSFFSSQNPPFFFRPSKTHRSERRRQRKEGCRQRQARAAPQAFRSGYRPGAAVQLAGDACARERIRPQRNHKQFVPTGGGGRAEQIRDGDCLRRCGGGWCLRESRNFSWGTGLGLLSAAAAGWFVFDGIRCQRKLFGQVQSPAEDQTDSPSDESVFVGA